MAPMSQGPRRTCCEGFTRGQLLGAAAAGAGLPTIEGGMPIPAGTGLSRRSFLFAAAGLTLSVYGAGRLGVREFEEGIARAAEAPPGRVLVSIFMPGGVDAMSLLAPVGDPGYARLRPKLALAAGSGPAFSQDPRLMWHPSAAGLARLHGEGKVSVLPAVGYPNPDQSHFTSRHYWEVGALDAGAQVGWLGRYLDRSGSPDNPLQGLSLNSNLSPALATAVQPVATLESPSAFTFSTSGVEEPVQAAMLGAIGGLGALSAPASDADLTGARRVVAAAGKLRGQLAPFVTPDGSPAYSTPPPYPQNSTFASRLAGLAALLAAGLPLHVVSVEAGDADFDTHADQTANLGPRLQVVMDSLLAFQRDLEARGLADRVLVSLWSEFGRRPEENDSGTDHGAAGAAFVIGTRAAGQMVGEFPGMGALDENQNLIATSDFRALYCALLEQWLGQDASAVMPDAAGLTRPAVVR
jgi:uncharacterized protein (DUF1501 family)